MPWPFTEHRSMAQVIEDEQPKHSPLGASSSERWIKCPGSVALIRRVQIHETDEPDFRMVGTAAHAAAAQCLVEELDAWQVMDREHEGIKLGADDLGAVQDYLDYVREIPGERFVEQRISSPDHVALYGTVDCYVLSDDGTTLDVIDYKHGAGVVVEVERNTQAMYYAYGVLLEYPEMRVVRIHIVQPRAFHPDGIARVWETTADVIHHWVESELLPAMERVDHDDTLQTGEHCRFCPAKLICPAALRAFDAATEPLTVAEMPDEELARRYQDLAIARMLIKAVEAEVERRLNEGRAIEGAKLVYKRANRVWTAEAEAFFVAKLGDKALTKPELRSPADMEKLPMMKELVKQYAHSPQSGTTVAPADDKRSEVKPIRMEDTKFAKIAHKFA